MGQATDGQVLVTPPPTPPRSETQGALAGLIATVIGVPALALGLVVALVLQATVLRKILHHDVDYSETRTGGTAILANIVLAVLIGFFAAIASGMISIKLVKQAASLAFTVVAAIGALVIAFGIDRWLLPRAQGHAFDLAMLVGFGWVAAVAGFYLAAYLRDVPEKPGRKTP